MKVKLIKKIKKNAPLEKEVDLDELKMRHAGRTDFDFTACAYEDLQDDLGKEQKVEDQVTRDILFRGKRVDNGEWVKGCYGLTIAISAAADVRPVVHGEWWPAKDGYYGHVMCSACHKIESHDTDFCPNCGADMRKPQLLEITGQNADADA